MIRTIAAAIFALFAVTAPAHAAYLDTLDANLDLNFGSSTQLTGSIDLQWSTLNGHGPRVNDYILTDSNLSVNGTHVGAAFGNQNAFSYGGTTVEIFVPSGPLDFVVFGLNTNYLPPNPTFANFLLDGTPATGGTVTVNSESLATPLPDALPMFGAALFALGGFAACRSRRAVRG